MHCRSPFSYFKLWNGIFFAENDIEYDPEECILRQEVSINGKSRAFINDTPASLAQMKLLGEKLIDVHSQHQNLLLNKEGFQLNILDILAQDDRQLVQYQQVYTDYKQVCRELDDFIAQAEKVAKTKIIFVSNWNSWRKLTYKKANKQNWSKKQIR